MSKIFHPTFLKLAQGHSTPRQVQDLLQSLRYNEEKQGATIRSALLALKAREAHCLEGAFVAAALLEIHGFPPLILDLESIDGLDHVVFVFRQDGCWGAIGRSKQPGLEGRAPVFRSIRDLAWSYYDPYIDDSGRLSSYQLVNLDEARGNWRTSSRNLWRIEDFLLSIPHRKMSSSETRYQRIFRKIQRGETPRPQSFWW